MKIHNASCASQENLDAWPEIADAGNSTFVINYVHGAYVSCSYVSSCNLHSDSRL